MNLSPNSPDFSSRYLWIAVGAFLLLLWSGIAGSFVLIARSQEQSTREDAARLAQALAMQTEQLLQSIDTMLSILERRIGTEPLTTADTSAILDEMHGQMPDYLDFAVFDHEGRGMAATVRNFKVGASFADRDYFQAQRDEPNRGAYLGDPIVGRSAGAHVLPMSIAIKGADGRFAGVLLAAIHARHLAKLFERFALGEKGLIALLRRDPLQIVARAPGQTEWFARNVEQVPAFADIVRGEKSGFISAAAADGIPRLIAWQGLERYPLVVTVGLSHDDLAAATANERRAILGGGLITTLLALIAGFALARAQARTHEAFLAQQRLVELHERDAQQLAEAADTLNRAQRVAHIGSWHLDIQQNRLDWSDETYRIFGVTDNHPLSYEDFLARVHPDDREMVDAAWQDALQGAPYDIVHRIVVAGETKWVREQAEFKFDAQGRLLAGIGTVQDVTRQRLDQIALEESRAAAEAANRAKSEFLANMSHEIRTPMNAILGLTQLTLDGPLEDGQRELLTNALASGRALLSILNDILDYSKIEAGRMEIAYLAYSPADVLKEAGDLFAAQIKEKSLSLDIEIDPALPAEVVGDPLRLGQVLANLVGNAVKFTERGGITLSASLAAERPEGLMLRFAVRDTGIGLDRATAGRLFQPFTQADGSITRRHGGTGLGLAICKKLVTLMGGEIGVTSEPGQGATFSFTIVVERADGAAPAASTAAAQKSALGGRRLAGRVLVVEDNPFNQQVARGFLEKRGLKVRIAGNGALGLEAVLRESFDLVLMDLHMPVIDGLEAARRIRALPGRRHVPIVAMTAAVTAEDRARCEAAGMDDFVAKPIDPEELARVLERLLPAAKATGDAIQEPPPASQDEAALPGLEPSRALARLGDDRALYARLLEEFAAANADFAERLVTHLAANETRQAVENLHALKGAAANLGMPLLAEAARELEARIISGERRPALQALIDALAEARAVIAVWLARQREDETAVAIDLPRLLETLRPWLVAREIAPDELIAELARAARQDPSGRLARLLRQIDDFDHVGALATLDALTASAR